MANDQVVLEQPQCPQQHHCKPVLLSPMLESPGKEKLTSLQKIFQPLFTEQTLLEPALPASHLQKLIHNRKPMLTPKNSSGQVILVNNEGD